MTPTINRLFLQSDLECSGVPFVSVRGYVQGVERLRVSPVLRIHNADHLLQLLEVFGSYTVTELALDLRRITTEMDGEFWKRFFAALPHLRRLELLSCTVGSRKIKRAIAEQFLASSGCRVPRDKAHGVSLGWVLRAVRRKEGTETQLEGELDDVKQVLNGYAEQGVCLERLELYVTIREPGSCKPEFDLTKDVSAEQVGLGCAPRWLLHKDYLCRLAKAAEVVTLGGQAELRPDDSDDDDELGSDGLAEDELSEDGRAEEYGDEDEGEDEGSCSDETE